MTLKSSKFGKVRHDFLFRITMLCTPLRPFVVLPVLRPTSESYKAVFQKGTGPVHYPKNDLEIRGSALWDDQLLKFVDSHLGGPPSFRSACATYFSEPTPSKGFS